MMRKEQTCWMDTEPAAMQRVWRVTAGPNAANILSTLKIRSAAEAARRLVPYKWETSSFPCLLKWLEPGAAPESCAQCYLRHGGC